MLDPLPSASELIGSMYSAPERLSDLSITVRAVYYAGWFG